MKLVSPATRNGSRLVARMRSSGQARSSASASSAHASIRCSQLSSTRSAFAALQMLHERLGRRAVRRLAHAQRRATARTTSSGSERGASSTNHTPPSNSSTRSLAHRQGQARLARPPGAAKRQEAPIGEQPLDLGDLPLAPDEARHLQRQVVRRAPGRALPVGGYGRARPAPLPFESLATEMVRLLRHSGLPRKAPRSERARAAREGSYPGWQVQHRPLPPTETILTHNCTYCSPQTVPLVPDPVGTYLPHSGDSSCSTTSSVRFLRPEPSAISLFFAEKLTADSRKLTSEQTEPGRLRGCGGAGGDA